MSEPLILERRSGYYGLIKFRYLGTIDVGLLGSGHDGWLEKHHPARFFPARWAVNHKSVVWPDGRSVVTAWSEWVPTRTDNARWKPQAGTPYASFASKGIGLPIGSTDKKIEKWLAASRHLLIDNPNAMAEAIAARNEMESTR
ncbi:hypothetical protein UFOVP75_56 [uncultured Caudovirales phage]|uniref:Uncharacterized protein n=1 Tax=uncultured Caudovirales phage TaxID=2100421 RepID=A0A6J5KX23_9CAUD|nr:hypothetical protein UFOVP75_56 [uncultured Caudovirales phage]